MTQTTPYDGPPDYRNVGIHGMSPQTSHDEKARFNFLAHLNRHLAANILPGVKTAYETRVRPNHPKPNHRHQVRKALLEDPLFQHWSALRRGTMELRQQAGRWITLRQADELNAKAEEMTKDDPRLVLDADLKIPRYLSAIDHHCMPVRYGLARAKSMGVENITFVQANAEDLSMYDDGYFDWVQSTMFLHETSVKAMPKIMKESHRLLAPGGLVMHVEQPQYASDMSLYEQAIRDWDAYYNNEPFWTKMHELDLDQWMIDAGFSRSELLHGDVAAVVDTTLFPEHANDDIEDYGRKAAWHIVGAEKAA